jgi:hypothetical protein
MIVFSVTGQSLKHIVLVWRLWRSEDCCYPAVTSGPMPRPSSDRTSSKDRATFERRLG